jgi:tetratricopeptide (TPR) repeat protein
MKRFIVVSAVGCAALATIALTSKPVAAQNKDTIVGAKGSIEGTVMRMNKTQVFMETNSVETAYKTSEIKKLEFAVEPAELGQARDHVLGGRYNDAVIALQKIDRSSVKLDFVQQDISFYLSLCAAKLALRGEFQQGTDKAIEYVKKEFVDNPACENNFHYFDAVEALADLYYATGDFATSEQLFQRIFDGALPEQKVRAKLRIGQSQLAAQKYKEASDSFDGIINANLSAFEDGDQQKAFAQLGKAVCIAGSGNAQAGVTMLEGIIRDGDPERDKVLFGRAYNALGDCYQQAGRTKDALLAYLHTDTLFYQDRDAHAEALYNLSKLWAAENKADRAREAREALATRYAGTVWEKLVSQ